MLTKDERKLLEQIIEADNRLFDRQSTVADLHDLLFATGKALAGTRFAALTEATTVELEQLLKSKSLPDQKRDRASEITDRLRKFVAEELRRDALENPKQRHL